MSSQEQDPATAPVTPPMAPPAAPVVPSLVAPATPAPRVRPPQQPEYHPRMRDAEWEALRPVRDASINQYLREAVEARRRAGTPLANETLYSPIDRAGYVSDHYRVRVHPVTGLPGNAHNALDITTANKDNVNVVGMRSGTVIYRGYFSPNAGYSIMVLDDNGEINFYAHLAAGSFEHIQPGQRIRQGQIIGEMGESGFATERHVHITTRRLSPAALAQSAQAQAQQVSFEGLMVQPIDTPRVADPAFSYDDYESFNPPILGRTYTSGDRVPAPPAEVLRAGNPLPRLEDFFPPPVVPTLPVPTQPLPATNVEETPTDSGLQNPNRDRPADRPVSPF